MAPRPYVLRMRRDLGGVLQRPSWPSDIGVRTLAKQDAQQAHAVLASGYWEGGGGAPNFRRWWTQLSKDAEFDPTLCFLAVDGEGVCGIAQCWTSAFVKDLAVHPRARRRGVGRALMLTVFEAFDARRADFVDLKVREENVTAQALYRQLGMHVVGRELG
jgi:ribosomal protein S18 acetylase RimI-like enzyme